MAGLLRQAGLSILPIVLLLAGCTSIPSKMYITTKDALPSPDFTPAPRDTFPLGEHPMVVVEGFEGTEEALLEISTNGNVIWQQSFPLRTGSTEDTKPTSPFAYTESEGGFVWKQGLNVYINAGFLLDMGMVPAGSYDLALKTNNTVAAVAHFKVILPPELENELQEIQSGRLKLEESIKAIKQLRLEIEQYRPGTDLANAVQVSAFNRKVQHYNQLLQEIKFRQDLLNKSVQKYNDQLSSYGLKVR